jgi:hypothetical protein
MGKAVNTASATVTKGTRARMVVNVRLLAVRPRRSSRNRSRSVWAVVAQGKRDNSATKACRRWTTVCGVKDMADMILGPATGRLVTVKTLHGHGLLMDPAR